MNPRILFLVRLLGFLCLLASAQAGPQWNRLKVGMSSDEAVRHLGQPLLKLKARGLERWIYDGSGEVVFYGGPVKFWTPSSPSSESEAKPVESDVMFRPARTGGSIVITPITSPAAAESAPTDGPRFRYR